MARGGREPLFDPVGSSDGELVLTGELNLVRADRPWWAILRIFKDVRISPMGSGPAEEKKGGGREVLNAGCEPRRKVMRPQLASHFFCYDSDYRPIR